MFYVAKECIKLETVRSFDVVKKSRLHTNTENIYYRRFNNIFQQCKQKYIVTLSSNHLCLL